MKQSRLPLRGRWGCSEHPKVRFPQILIEIRKQCLIKGVVPEQIVFNESKSFLACMKDKEQALMLESLVRKATKPYQHNILHLREYRENISKCFNIIKEFFEEQNLTCEPVNPLHELPSNISSLPWWIVVPAQKPITPAAYLKQQVIFLCCMKKILKLCDEIHQHSKQLKITINSTTRKLVQSLCWAGAYDIMNNNNVREGILLAGEAKNRHELIDGSTITIKFSFDAIRYLSSQKNSEVISSTLSEALGKLCKTPPP